MRHSARETLFDNRYDAGRKLAEKMGEYAGKNAIVLAIPNGGVVVALGVALAVGGDFDLVISRKLPLPLSPEGGFGSVTDDGTLILDEAMVKHAGLTKQQIDFQVNQVRRNIMQRSLLYHRDRRPLSLSNRIVVIVDDGLASGYTMRAAIASIRKRNPAKVIAAVPVGPERVINDIKKVADQVVVCVAGTNPEFYVSDYYRTWYDVTDDEVLNCLKEFGIRKRGGGVTKTPEKRPDLPARTPYHRLPPGSGR
jgi:predicted phosphoribosyltransferase